MKRAPGKRSLESFPFFPYVAWTTIVVFAIFVYHLAGTVSEQAAQLQKVQTDVQQLSDQLNDPNS